MPDPITTIGLALLAGLSLTASVLAVLRLRRLGTSVGLRRTQFSLTGLCISGTAGLFIYRALTVTNRWQPLVSHVDGLLLMSCLFAATVLFVQRARLKGLAAFALPLFTVILTWGVCASAWTYERFAVRTLWMGAHSVSLYLGSLFFCVAAAAGGMYLYVQHSLHRHRDPAAISRLASLEAIESLNIRTATIGFSLLTLGLVTGLIMSSTGSTRLGPQWWFQPKIVLSVMVWLIYAIVMNVRYATAFRGSRAAWLSIVGLVLLMATFVIAMALPDAPIEPDNMQVVWTTIGEAEP